MKVIFVQPVLARNLAAICILLGALALWPLQAAAQMTAFNQAVAVAAAKDRDIAAFYKARDYAPIWTGREDASRRNAFFATIARVGDHGLAGAGYDADALIAAFRAVRSERARGQLEVEMSRAFLAYARDVQTGMLSPSKVDSGIARDVPLRDRLSTIQAFAESSPSAFLKSLPPSSPEYLGLMKEKLALERLLGQGGWGPRVQAKVLKPGQSGTAVVQLRDRLQAMGYLGRSASQDYDATLQKAVQDFQSDHGLTADGVAGESTLAEINVDPVARLQAVIVAMERERWTNMERGERHIWVNLTDFTAKIVDDGKVTFVTRSVVGKNGKDTRSPEFSDQMEFMVVNPTWNVPRSITTKEYLPLMQANPDAAGHLTIIDAAGRAVSRSSIDFSQYTAKTFPYAMKQPPSDGNALGLVKFMFPNKHNIYLHDTPSKSLFNREVRAFSHGCIRLGDPFDFAYALLARQTKDPVGDFKRYLATGVETVVSLHQPVPVHIVYRTAFTAPKGKMNYRRDIYGRDGRIFEALAKAGVVLRGVQG
jgi:L,D-transpeptidase YcbB